MDNIALFTDAETGMPVTPKQLKEFLHKEIERGYQYIAFGGCDNRLPDGRCGGHPSKSDTTEPTNKSDEKSNRQGEK